jgi:hypothetical protein
MENSKLNTQSIEGEGKAYRIWHAKPIDVRRTVRLSQMTENDVAASKYSRAEQIIK